MLSNLAVSTHFGGISVAMEGREKSPSVAKFRMLRFGAFWRRIRFPSVPNPAEVQV
jgi:hypothetical protein